MAQKQSQCLNHYTTSDTEILCTRFPQSFLFSELTFSVSSKPGRSAYTDACQKGTTSILLFQVTLGSFISIFFSLGKLSAFEYGNACMQPYFMGVPPDGSDLRDLLPLYTSYIPRSENCLFLNVWVPHPQREKRAVLVSMSHFLVYRSRVLPR